MKIKTVLLPLFAVLFAISPAAFADDYIVPQRILDLHNYACENGSAVDCQSYHQLIRGNEKAKRVRQQRQEREERKEKQRQEREAREAKQRREQEQQRREQEKKKTQEVRMRYAAQNSDIAEVNRLLDDGVDVNSFDDDGNTALHLATLNGNIEIVKALLLSGANLNAANNDGNTVLDLAFTGKNIEVIRVLHKANEEQMELKARNEKAKAEINAQRTQRRIKAIHEATQAKLEAEAEVKRINAELNAEKNARAEAIAEAVAEVEEANRAKYRRLIWILLILAFGFGGGIYFMWEKQKGTKE